MHTDKHTHTHTHTKIVAILTIQTSIFQVI